MNDQNQSQKPKQPPGQNQQKPDQPRSPQEGQDLPGQAQPGQRQPGQEQDKRQDEQNPGGRRARAEDEPAKSVERDESDGSASERN